MNLTETILELITNKNCLSNDKLSNIVEDSCNVTEIHKLRDLIETLQSKSIEVRYTEKADEIQLRTNEIKGCLKVISGRSGKLDKLIIKPFVPEIDSIESLINTLSILGGDVDSCVSYEYIDTNFSAGKKSIAVSSLFKIVVSAALCDEIRKGHFKLSTRYRIQENDISFLSAGLRYKDIGQEVSIKDLLSLMLLASDNSAMDIVIKLIGITKLENYINRFSREHNSNFLAKIELSKILYGEAWNIKEVTQYEPKNYMNLVRWNLGFDYFFPLDLINQFSLELSNFEWLPWDDLGKEPIIIYKGGSAPGVLSALWCTRHQSKNKVLSFAINRDEPYNILEELFAYESARKLLLKLKIL